MFRTVDGYTIDSAVDVFHRTVLPHASQLIGLLDTPTADQRARLTAEDVIGPLDMLFEFGELDCAFPVDPNLKPVIFFGPDTVAFGTGMFVNNIYM